MLWGDFYYSPTHYIAGVGVVQGLASLITYISWGLLFGRLVNWHLPSRILFTVISP